MTGPTPSDAAQMRAQLETLHQESFAWARSCCGIESGEAEEVLHMSYQKILSGRATCDGAVAFKPWWFGVIRLTAREYRRRLWLRWLRLAPLETAVEQAATARRPDEAMTQSETIAEVRVALERLSARQREVLLLVFAHDLTLDQAAEALGVSPGSARTHYERGKQRLRELLRADLPQPVKP